jgi:L-asparagine transporter-like permease
MSTADSPTSAAAEGGLKPGLKSGHMRRQLERDAPEKLKVKMWLYPWLTWFSIVAIVAIVASMAVIDDEATRSYLVPSLVSLAIVVAAAFLRGRRVREPAATPGPRQAARPGAA